MAKRKDHKGKILLPGEYQRKNGTYEYRWTNRLGERQSVYAKTLTDLRNLEEEIISKSQTQHCPSTLTFGDLYEMWMETKTNLKDSTKHLYGNLYKNHVLLNDYHLDKMRVGDITKVDMKRYFASVYSGHRLCAEVLQRLYVIIRQVFEFAVDDDMIDRNPVVGAQKDVVAKAKKDEMAQGTPQVKALTRDEQERFFPYFEEHDRSGYYRIFRLQLLTGMRIGEALGLQWSDINFLRAEVRIAHTLSYNTGMPRMSSTKNSKVRFVPLCDEAIAILQEQRALIDSLGLKVKRPVDGYSDFVFVSSHNNTVRLTDINFALKRVVAKYNETADKPLPNISSHWFRHTFATRMFEANVSPRTVQELLGHSTLDITMGIYTSVMEDVKQDAMSQFVDHLASFESCDRTKLTTNSVKVT